MPAGPGGPRQGAQQADEGAAADMEVDGSVDEGGKGQQPLPAQEAAPLADPTA